MYTTVHVLMTLNDIEECTGCELLIESLIKADILIRDDRDFLGALNLIKLTPTNDEVGQLEARGIIAMASEF